MKMKNLFELRLVYRGFIAMVLIFAMAFSCFGSFVSYADTVSRGDPLSGMVSGGDVSGGDVSGGDVSGGDVSGGDVSGGNIPEEPPVEANADINAFPESYRAALLALRAVHPNWTFEADFTGLDFWTAVNAESTGAKSLIYFTNNNACKELLQGTNWYYASPNAVAYYMDPRNHLTETGIFQFELLSYNEAQTLEALENYLSTTFMSSANGNMPYTTTVNCDYSYAYFLKAFAEYYQVSPFHIASRILQEQGNGTSPLISGTYPGYENIYNYFNISASGSTNSQIILNGLNYARDHGWNTVYASIDGGTAAISQNYIAKGQDTLYYEKFNVAPRSQHARYTHQYMQNIAAPSSESSKTRNIYAGAGALDIPLVFRIPVYSNMPEAVCTKPVSSSNVAINIPSDYDRSAIWIDGTAVPCVTRNGYCVADAGVTTAKTAVVMKYSGTVPVGMKVYMLTYTNGGYIATEEPLLENLIGYHGFSVRITGNSGIRFKSSIDASLRYTLLTSGVDGYTLKEYGTLVMINSNRGTYPMIRNGQKVITSMAYGMQSNGTLYDYVFDTVSGRYVYTSVLVGLPVAQYKTQFSFRGYAVLSKGGTDTVVYGPVMNNSIYDLSRRLVNAGSYSPGSASGMFLQKIINDADGL